MVSENDMSLGCLALLLVIATITDLTRRRVYNWLTYSAMILGMAMHAIGHGFPGLLASLLGIVAGGLVFFPAFYWGGMGAGDIKLMAAIGSFMGWLFAVNTALYAALAGGVVAIGLLAGQGELWNSLKNIGFSFKRCFFGKTIQHLPPHSRKQALPYAVIIAIGAVIAYFIPFF